MATGYSISLSGAERLFIHLFIQRHPESRPERPSRIGPEGPGLHGSHLVPDPDSKTDLTGWWVVGRWGGADSGPLVRRPDGGAEAEKREVVDGVKHQRELEISRY